MNSLFYAIVNCITRSKRAIKAVCASYLLFYSLSICAQTIPKVDSEDIIGQRLGWTVNKIKLSIENQGAFTFYKQIPTSTKGTTLLVFVRRGSNKIVDESCSTLLSYTIKEGISVNAWLRITQPPKQSNWENIVGSWIPEIGHGYLSMYAMVRVNEGSCSSAKSYSLVYKPDIP